MHSLAIETPSPECNRNGNSWHSFIIFIGLPYSSSLHWPLRLSTHLFCILSCPVLSKNHSLSFNHGHLSRPSVRPSSSQYYGLSCECEVNNGAAKQLTQAHDDDDNISSEISQKCQKRLKTTRNCLLVLPFPLLAAAVPVIPKHEPGRAWTKSWNHPSYKPLPLFPLSLYTAAPSSRHC